MFTLEQVKYLHILDIEQLTLPEGRITCLLGSSGSGKTTLLRLLNLMRSPTSGTVRYQGRDLAQEDAVRHRRNVVTVPQTPVLYPGTVADNLQKGRVFCQRPPVSQAHLKQGLAAMRLDKSLDEPADTLSGGERQRLCLLRSLMIDAETYLLDEPTSALDQATTGFVLDAFCGACHRAQKTLVMVTHDPGVAERYGETIVTLQNGRVAGVQNKEAQA